MFLVHGDGAGLGVPHAAGIHDVPGQWLSASRALPGDGAVRNQPRASLVVFAVFFNTGMPSTTGVLQAVFNPENWSFVAVYSAVGGVFAALVFSTSVVSIPMILDRDTDALTAGITSIRVVLENPLTMLLWGALITLLVGASLWAGSVALVLVGPLLGHASWHAYRAAVQRVPAAAMQPELARALAPKAKLLQWASTSESKHLGNT